MDDVRDPNAPAEEAMPQPQPVFDLTYQHVYTPGAVFKQFYVFLWCSVAFLLGAILSWNAEGKMGVLEGVICLFGIGATWTCIANIKGRRLTMWPVLLLELIVVLSVAFVYKDVGNQRQASLNAFSQSIDTRMLNAPDIATKQRIRAEWEPYDELMDWGMLDVVQGPIASFKPLGSVERKRIELAWSRFGPGFHLSWMTAIFVFLFFIGSLVFAIVAAIASKKPEESGRGAGGRRRSGTGGRAKLGGDKPLGDKPLGDKPLGDKAVDADKAVGGSSDS